MDRLYCLDVFTVLTCLSHSLTLRMKCGNDAFRTRHGRRRALASNLFVLLQFDYSSVGSLNTFFRKLSTDCWMWDSFSMILFKNSTKMCIIFGNNVKSKRKLPRFFTIFFIHLFNFPTFSLFPLIFWFFIHSNGCIGLITTFQKTAWKSSFIRLFLFKSRRKPIMNKNGNSIALLHLSIFEKMTKFAKILHRKCVGKVSAWKIRMDGKATNVNERTQARVCQAYHSQNGREYNHSTSDIVLNVKPLHCGDGSGSACVRQPLEYFTALCCRMHTTASHYQIECRKMLLVWFEQNDQRKTALKFKHFESRREIMPLSFYSEWLYGLRSEVCFFFCLPYCFAIVRVADTMFFFRLVFVFALYLVNFPTFAWTTSSHIPYRPHYAIRIIRFILFRWWRCLWVSQSFSTQNESGIWAAIWTHTRHEYSRRLK